MGLIVDDEAEIVKVISLAVEVVRDNLRGADDDIVIGDHGCSLLRVHVPVHRPDPGIHGLRGEEIVMLFHQGFGGSEDQDLLPPLEYLRSRQQGDDCLPQSGREDDQCVPLQTGFGHVDLVLPALDRFGNDPWPGDIDHHRFDVIRIYKKNGEVPEFSEFGKRCGRPHVTCLVASAAA